MKFAVLEVSTSVFEIRRAQFAGEAFKCTLQPRPDLYFVSPPGRHDSLALRQLLVQAQISDVLEDEMELAEQDRFKSILHAAAHIYFYTIPGDGLANFTTGLRVCEFSTF